MQEYLPFDTEPPDNTEDFELGHDFLLPSINPLLARLLFSF
jgi:hypothetical protein